MDRFLRGFIIGITSSAVKDILSFISYSLGITKKTYAHLMGAMLFGRHTETVLELATAQLVELFFEGFVGIVFIYYAYRTFNKKNLWFKGVFFALAVYSITYIIGTIFRVPVLYKISIVTTLSNLTTSLIYGIILGYFTYWWGKKRGDFTEENQIL